MDKTFIEDSLVSISSDKRYIIRYFKLINAFKDYTGETFEKHHILPRCLFPEYIKSEWNIIKIPPRVHYIAHFLLYKSRIDSKLTFAFNMMNVNSSNQYEREMSNILNHSKLYEKFKEDMADAIRESNCQQVTVTHKESNEKVRISSEEYSNNRDKYIHANTGNVLIRDEIGGYTTICQSDFDPNIHNAALKGMVTVKDKEGNTSSVSQEDPRYLSGELISVMTGMISVKDLSGEWKYITSDEYQSNKCNYVHHSTNIVIATDKNGNKCVISSDEYENGEYTFHTKNMIVVRDKEDNVFSVPTDDPRYLSGELVFHGTGKVSVKDVNGNNIFITSEEYQNNKDKYTHSTTGYATVKDNNGNMLKVSIDDERYIRGELVGSQKGTVSVKDLQGNKYRVSLTDERYLSGEFIPVSRGYKWYHNPLTGDRRHCDEGKQPEGYIRGMGSRINS